MHIQKAGNHGIVYRSLVRHEDVEICSGTDLRFYVMPCCSAETWTYYLWGSAQPPKPNQGFQMAHG